MSNSKDPHPAAGETRTTFVPPRHIESDELLGDSNQVFILHAGQVYTLRRTRENKLILTK